MLNPIDCHCEKEQQHSSNNILLYATEEKVILVWKRQKGKLIMTELSYLSELLLYVSIL